MAYKYKRRKIKRTKRKSMYKKKKSTAQKVITAVLTVIILIILVFVGFSVGKPIIDYINKPADDSSSSEIDDVSDNDDYSSVYTGSESVDDNNSSEPTVNEFVGVKAVNITADCLTDIDLLNAALSDAKENGYNAVIVDMVAEGGLIYYKTEEPKAIAYEAVMSELTAKEISDAISDADMTSIARFSVLTDHIVSRMDKEIGYTFGANVSTWVDNAPELGGKAWISPFKDKAIEYLGFLAKEINVAGFDYVLACDVEFPFMRNSDMNYLGESVKSPTRYTALHNVINGIREYAEIRDKIILDVSAYGVLNGSEEVFTEQPEVSGVNLNIDLSELPKKITTFDAQEISLSDLSSYEKAKLVLEEVSTIVEGYDIFVTVRKSDYTEEDFSLIIDYLRLNSEIKIIIK